MQAGALPTVMKARSSSEAGLLTGPVRLGGTQLPCGLTPPDAGPASPASMIAPGTKDRAMGNSELPSGYLLSQKGGTLDGRHAMARWAAVATGLVGCRLMLRGCEQVSHQSGRGARSHPTTMRTCR